MTENLAEDLNLVVTEERLREVDLETFYNLEKTSSASIDFIAHFMVDEAGTYMQKSDALKVLFKGRKIKDIESIAEQLMDEIQENAVPKT